MTVLTINAAIFATLFVSESMSIVSSDESCTRSLLDKVTFIANTSFDPRKSTLIAWSDNADYIAVDFLKSYIGVVTLVNLKVELYNNVIANKGDQLLLFVDNSQAYNLFLQKIIHRDQVTPVRIILMLLQTEDNGKENYNQILDNITLSSFKNDVTDVVILNCDDKQTIQINTYYPYSNNESCNNTQPRLLKVNSESEYFPRKFKDFCGCPIRASAMYNPPFMDLKKHNEAIIDVDGTEGKLVKLVAQALNAKLIYLEASDKGAYGTIVQGRWTGSVGDLVNKLADISAIGAHLNYGRFQVSQFTYYYRVQKILWCAPQQREIHVWAKAVLPLLTDSTFLLGVSSILFLIVSKISRRVKYESNDPPKDSTLFLSWAIFLGQQVHFESKSWLMNCLFGLWLGLCLILRISYQGELSIYLQRQTLEPPYTSLSEALAGVDAYGGYQSILAFYSDPDFLSNFNNLTFSQISTWLDGISKGKRLMVSYEPNSLYELGYAHKVQIVEEAAISAPVGVLMRRRWSAAEEISRLVMRITEAGLYDKIVKDRQENYRLIFAKTKKSKDNLQFNTLGWYTLGACFYGLIIEWCVCIVIFLLEKLWVIIKQNKNTAYLPTIN